MSCSSKDILKMYPVVCTNTHHHITDLVNHGWVKIQKVEYLENRTYFFCKLKKFLNCASDDTILRSYRFLVEVTFKTSL